MNIGLIGSGGREHALCQKIFESKFSNKIVVFHVTMVPLELIKI